MKSKEAIKQVLRMGSAVSLPYKAEINQWYGEIKINKIDEFYIIQPSWIKFYDIDEAVNYFCSEALTSKNVGYIQSRLDDKGYNFEIDYNLEKPSAINQSTQYTPS